MSAPAPGPHGGDAVAVAAALGIDPSSILDLSASLNPFAPDVTRVVREHADRITRYPDPTGATTAVAEAIGVDATRLVLTNGGAEAIALVAASEPVGSVAEPEFSLYARHLREVRDDAGRWRSNPSNPLGRLADPADRATVWDEAFWPLATGAWTRGDDAAWRLGSLTKLWACPGLRLGYVIAPDAGSAEDVRVRQPRWSVNALALAAVDAVLTRTDLPRWSRALARQRRTLVDELTARGLRVHDTEACWVLVEHGRLRQALLTHRILVRDCRSFGLAGTFRVAVPDDDGLARLLDAIDRIR